MFQVPRPHPVAQPDAPGPAPFRLECGGRGPGPLQAHPDVHQRGQHQAGHHRVPAKGPGTQGQVQGVEQAAAQLRGVSLWFIETQRHSDGT